MSIDINRLATLTRLSLDEKEIKQLETDLTGILAYADQLRGIDTTHVAEIPRAASEINVLRADAVSEKKEEENAEMIAALRNAFPDKEEEYARVPPVFTKHES